MKKWWLIIGVVLLSACEEAVDWQLKRGDLPPLVVEGWLTNELKRQRIKLSKPKTSLNGVQFNVSGAQVTVFDGDTAIQFIEEPEGSGIYLSDTLQAVVGKEYQLRIDYNDEVFTAETSMVPVSPLLPLNFIPNEESQDFFYIKEVASDQPAMEELLLDWSSIFEEEPGPENTARLFFYVLEASDVNQLFPPRSERVYFPRGTRVQRIKYSLNVEQQDFIRSLLMETNWRGGVFDVQKNNVITNISGGAVGFFAASSVIKETVIVE
jgi:hypothetical protein